MISRGPYASAFHPRTIRVLAGTPPRDLCFLANAGFGCHVGGSLRAEARSRIGFTASQPARRIRGTGISRAASCGTPVFASTRIEPENRRSHVAGLYAFGRGGRDDLTKAGPLPLGTLGLRGSSGRSILPWRVEDVDIRSGSLGPLTGALAFHGGSFRRLDGRVCPRTTWWPSRGHSVDGSGTAGRLRGQSPRRPARTRGGRLPGSGLPPRSDKSASPRPPRCDGSELAGRVDLERC